MPKSIIIFASTLLLAGVHCSAATINVNWDGSGDYTTIQAAINAAVSGADTVVVAEGTYFENISFGGKNIILTSTDPDDPNVVADTIIDGGGGDSVVKFDGTESSNCKLSGFTISNGYANTTLSGGGICGDFLGGHTQATVTNCTIRDNVATEHAGGIQGVDGLIDRCIIYGNSTVNANGGGLSGCNGTISNCLIYNNTATLNGGGMVMCNGDIVNCTIADNTAGESGGGMAWCGSATITNCIIWGNNLEQINGGSPTYSCIQDWPAGGIGNITTNPGFVDPCSADYHLLPDSFCIDAGTNSPPPGLPSEDLEGRFRPMDGDNDDLAIADMGCYESLPSPYPVIELSQNQFIFSSFENGPNPQDQILTIRNMGSGTLNWVVTEECDWLVANPITGNSVSEPNVTLSIDISELTSGKYNCQLTISDPNALNSPQFVIVNLYVHDDDGVLYVPSEYITIQYAIDLARLDEIIIVSMGTYFENISFGGKNIILTSTDPNNPNVVADTIIDGGGVDTVVRFNGTETGDCKLLGFTITNGYGPGDDDGGGISGAENSATVANCVIQDNIAQLHGGGIRNVNGLIDRCIVTGNSTVNANGGGLSGCNGTISNCLIYNNTATLTGGGMVMCNGDIVNCTIADNTAGVSGGGMAWCGNSTITNCIIWGNNQEQIDGGEPTYSCIQDWPAGGTGNITTNPGFVDPCSDDYHLLPDSFCIDAGTNCPPCGLPWEDLEGKFRPLDGDNDDLALADMGCYESLPSPYPVIELSQNQFIFSSFENGQNPQDQILTIRNIGSGTLNWVVTEECDWLTASPADGSSTGEPNEIALTVDISGLSEGIYYCQLTISDPCAPNSPKVVDAKLYIIPEPQDAVVVPFHYSTIQEAINNANDFDTIIVAPDRYVENISIGGKNIILTSIGPDDPCVVEETIIDGGGVDTVVRFNGTETGNCKLLGFTIINGYGPAEDDGGGITGADTSATVANCIIKDNIAQQYGGGIRGACGLIDRCIVADNFTIETNGGGLNGCNGTISNCLIYDNETARHGGGMASCNGDIVNCTVVNNTAGTSGGGIAWCGNATITNCIIWGNNQEQIAIGAPTYSCIQDWSGGGTGNISTDPGFIFPYSRDYHLLTGSPCIDAGNNNSVPSTIFYDLDGNTRFVDDPNTIDTGNGIPPIVDMGVYEYISPPWILAQPNVLSFSAIEGGMNPSVLTLSIKNGGTGEIDWSIAYDCDWLQIEPSSGSSAGEPNQVTLSVSVSGLTEDSYHCELIISAEVAINRQQIIDVWLHILPEDALLEDSLIVPDQYATIQDAIDAAVDGNDIAVRPGTYTGTGNRDISFGGKAVTVRSMDPDNPAIVTATVIDCQGSTADRHRGFVFDSGEERDSVLDGLTITNGYTTSQGGGVLCIESSPTLKNCVFKNNTSDFVGGGMFTTAVSNPKLVNCTFTNNTAECAGGGFGIFSEWYPEAKAKLVNCTFKNNVAAYGGGICYGELYELTLLGCTFSENSAHYGGAIGPFACLWSGYSANDKSDYASSYLPGTTITTTECLFTMNTAVHWGGAIYNIFWDNFILTNCEFSHNSAGDLGGAMCNSYTGPGLFKLSNCSFVGNSAADGSALACRYYGNLQIDNCILWNDGSEIYNIDPDSYEITVTYSCIRDEDTNDENIYPGTGNIDDYPLFADPNGPDKIFGTQDDNFRLLPGSPCIDAAHNTVVPENIIQDIDGFPRFFDDPHTADTGHGASNTSLNPQFTDPCANDFHLLPQSPCIDAGTNSPPSGLPLTDIEGQSRPIDGDNDGQAIADMGVYEFSPVGAYPAGSETPLNMTTGTERHVPYVYPSIQSAIDDANDFDTIIIAEGIYYENISLNGKNLVITSTNQYDPNVVAATIIDGGGAASVVTFDGTETSDCKIFGFTITNGYGDAEGNGGGITGAGTNATVANCIIKDNIAQVRGGGIQGVSGIIDRCIITDNFTTESNGGGLNDCHGTISNCLIYDNEAALYGGGIAWCNGDIVNCTITKNNAGEGQGGLVWCYGTITNCIIWGNYPDQLVGFEEPKYNCIQDMKSTSTVDIGAHEFIPCDFEPDGDIDEVDFLAFILYWLEEDCGRCGGADLTGEGFVDTADFASLASLWLMGTE